MNFTETSVANLALLARREAETFTVTIECGGGNEYDGRFGLRISSIFVILVGSLLGSLTPVMLARSPVRVPKIAFFLTKFFGSGVIIATAFIHLLAPAVEALSSPCLDEGSPITQYDWAEGICLMTVFVMFLAELLLDHFAVGVMHGAGAHDPAMDMIKKSGHKQDPEAAGGTLTFITIYKCSKKKLTVKPATETSVDELSSHANDEALAAQMTGLFILEFGVIFHSVFIGLTLAVAGDEFVILYIVLVFHQTFEGLGLGSRLATADWPRGRGWLPYVLGIAFSISTPIAIAVGIGVRETLKPESNKTMIVNGVFDSISAGILIYTGLVELVAREFMFSSEMKRAGIGMRLAGFACICVGAGLMALLGKWA